MCTQANDILQRLNEVTKHIKKEEKLYSKHHANPKYSEAILESLERHILQRQTLEREYFTHVYKLTFERS